MMIKKSGKGSRFLISAVPSRAKLLRRWAKLFGNAISPCDLFEALSARTHEFEHRENLLLFGKDRVIYDTQIFQGEESIGELTLRFESIADPTLGVLAYLKGARLRVVYIEHIRVTAQRSGYASTLFRYYERLFHDLGFNQFRLSAALSVGRYYWAQEGFDFTDKSEIDRRQGGAARARQGERPSCPRGRNRTTEPRLRIRPFQARAEDSRLPERRGLLFVEA